MTSEPGLFTKYLVVRTDGKPVNWCFVLEDNDPLTIPALEAYRAAAYAAGYQELPDDLRDKIIELKVANATHVLDDTLPAPEGDGTNEGSMTLEDVEYFRERGRRIKQIRQDAEASTPP